MLRIPYCRYAVIRHTRQIHVNKYGNASYMVEDDRRHVTLIRHERVPMLRHMLLRAMLILR